VAGFIEMVSEGEISREAVLIFLTVGNWHKGFDRLVRAVDDLKDKGVITEEVKAQIGSGCFRPNNLTIIDYCSPSEFVNFINEARLVISHAGVGTMGETIKRSKPIIVVPRKASLGEVGNDHQFITAKQLHAEGKILVAWDVAELPVKIIEAETFVPVRDNGAEKIIQTVEAFINKLAEQKGKR